MEDPREMLEEALEDLPKPDSSVVTALQELCYTADEGGIIQMKVDGELAEMMIRLVALAEKHRAGVPDEFRM